MAKQVQVKRPTGKRDKPDPDLRTPKGVTLPY